MGVGPVAATAATTVPDVVRRRRAGGGLPGPRTLRPRARGAGLARRHPASGDRGAARGPDRLAPRPTECTRGDRRRRRRLDRPPHRGHDLVGADGGNRLFGLNGPTWGPGWWPTRRPPRLGRPLLLEPPFKPREPLAVGDARRPPQQRALQPLDRAAPAGRRGPDDDRALRPARPRRGAAERHRERPRPQPHLPVLDPHRGGPADRVARERPQHPVAPPRPPRLEPRYLDRNHGSILIVWDRLFGTFEPEGERSSTA